MNRRAFVIIIDGVGIGELPDAAEYGDSGSNTLGNLAKATNGLRLPVLQKMGLGCIHPIKGMGCPDEPAASYGKMQEVSPGKDSTTGHWELGGLMLDKPFPTYPQGFPQEVMREFEEKTGLGWLGNIPASGTEIIKDLGQQHVESGKPIIYTSADSVFQIAAHEDVIPLQKLYEICRISRGFLAGKHQVARVIARPFTGSAEQGFSRTRNRKDFSVVPTGKTTLSKLQNSGIKTIAIGKINDLYAYDGIEESILTKSNEEGMKALSAAAKDVEKGFIMANLVDFDMLWGHRNNTAGFKSGLEVFDKWLGDFLPELRDRDILIITADHGNDPTTPSTDHSREFVPLLVYGHLCRSGINLGIRKTFADLDASILDYFDVKEESVGESFFSLLCKDK